MTTISYDTWFTEQLNTIAGAGNWEWTTPSGADVVVLDKSNFAAINMQILEHFFDKIEVEHVGAGNVAKLYAAGINTPIDAITATYDVYEGAVGSNGTKAHKSLHLKLTTLTPARLFAALGSFGRGMGERKLTALFNVFPLDQVLNGSISTVDIATIDGFENKSARKIIDRIDDARDQYHTVKDYVSFMMPKAKPVGGALSGQVFCPTGVRLSAAAVILVEKQGGAVTDTFNKSVTTLIAKDPTSGSSKIEKAAKMGINIVSLAEFNVLIGA